MDEKVLDCMKHLALRGNEVILYTDHDRKVLTAKTAEYGGNIVYLPDSVSANWGEYEVRCDALYEQLRKDKVDVLMYASPTSHIYWLDTLLASLSDIVVVDMQDEVYLNMLKQQLEKIYKYSVNTNWKCSSNGQEWRFL